MHPNNLVFFKQKIASLSYIFYLCQQKLAFMAEPLFINPFTDFGFKKIFGEEQNKDLLIDFLNELLACDLISL